MLVSEELFELALAFHGHKCPAMPLGLRAGAAAMDALGVERAEDKELHLVSETGKGHAAGCFLDGLMVVTGCTYGKSNVEKLYYNKMAFTLVDVRKGRAVRVSLKPEFVARMLRSPFVEQRRRGVPPQDVPPEIAEPLVERVLSLPLESFLEVGRVEAREFVRGEGVFDVESCSGCGEMVFVDKLHRGPDGRLWCIPCWEGRGGEGTGS